MTDFLEEKRKEIVGRMKELEPAVNEYQQLESVIAALGTVGNSNNKTYTKNKPHKKRAQRQRPQNRSGQRGRPRGSGTRAKEALALIKRRPGITVSELAREMKVQQNYLYRVMPGLLEQGLVKKKDRGWHAVGEK